MSSLQLEGTIHAPEFPPGLEWLNTAAPLTIEQLRGKVVVLDFWTYCCINCMHIIPDLKRLEAKYPNELVVIGVHSAKFDNEHQTGNIRAAIARYEIEHPVINDESMLVWRSYAVRAWPTLMLVNPVGRVIGTHSGEGIYDLFDAAIGETIAYFDKKGEIERAPLKLDLERNHLPPTLLSFPGKIVADESVGLLAFSDSNHNRIVTAALNGEVKDVIGDGEIGLRDGSLESARFFRPQGVFLDGSIIYVADTENHAIRKIDLNAKTVTTLCGDGNQARGFNQEGKGVRLNSPWDLVRVGPKLYIAMAGSHQIWTLDLVTLEARVHAGSGRENIVDGPLRESALAQPSGITTDGKRLYFADSEVSAIRAADIAPGGKVETLVGTGLFDFGDADGRMPRARLQHCIGIHYHEGALYVADTYNHKIRRFDLASAELTTVIGTGAPGFADGEAKRALLNEPNGLCFAGGSFYIADTNNHAIRVFAPGGNHVSTLTLRNMEKLAPRAVGPDVIQLERHDVSPVAAALELELLLPERCKLNAAAPSTVRVASDDADVAGPEAPKVTFHEPRATVAIRFGKGETTLTVDLAIYYCREGNEALCFFRDARLRLPVRVTADGGGTLKLTHRLSDAG